MIYVMENKYVAIEITDVQILPSYFEYHARIENLVALISFDINATMRNNDVHHSMSAIDEKNFIHFCSLF